MTAYHQPFESGNPRTRGPSILDIAPREPWWRRWFPGLFGRPAAPSPPAQPVELPPPPPPLDAYQEYLHSMLSPARGDMFDFAVQLRFEWHATGHAASHDSLLRQIAERHQRLIPEIETEVRSLTRRWDMYQCAEAEQDLNARLGNRGRLRDPVNGTPTFAYTIRAQVSLDSLLRDLERHAWLLEKHSKNGQRTVKREVDLLSERLRFWQDLIEQAEATPPSAVRLALRPDDQEAVLIGPTGQLTSGSPDGHGADGRSLERERELFQLAFEALKVHRQHGTAEAVFLGDYAIRDLLAYLGIMEVPPAAPPGDDDITDAETEDGGYGNT